MGNISPFPPGGSSSSSSSGGSSGIQSINGNTNTSQTIVGSGGTTVSSVGGTTTISSTATSPGGSDTYIQYNDGGVFGGSAKLTFNKTTGAVTLTPGATSPTQLFYINAPSIVDFDYLSNVTGLFNTTVNQTLARFAGTGNTASGRTTKTVSASISGGSYSSSSANIGFYSAMNTTNDYNAMDAFTAAAGEFGAFLDSSNGSTSGTTFGAAAVGRGGNKNVGVYGYGRDGTGSSPQNYGGRFIAVQDTGAQSVGVYARIYSTTGTAAENANPGLSSAFVADNGNTTGNIFTAMDNNSSLLQVKDGGTVVFGSENTGANSTLLYGRYVLNPKENDAGNSSTAININLQTGSSQKITLTGNATIVLGNPQTGGSYVLRLVQDATGTRTVTWPSSVKWPSGVAPTLTTTANKIDLINLYYDGTSYYGSFSLNY